MSVSCFAFQNGGFSVGTGLKACFMGFWGGGLNGGGFCVGKGQKG